MNWRPVLKILGLSVAVVWTSRTVISGADGCNPEVDDEVPPVTLSREAEVLLLLTAIPIDFDYKTDRFEVDPEDVTLAVKKLERFTNRELEAGIIAYRNWWGSDDIDDRIAKLYVVNAYLFDVPQWAEESKDALRKVNFREYAIPVKDGKISLQYPWMPDGSGDLKFGVKRLCSQRRFGLHYDGLAAFRALNSEFPRRNPEKIETKKSGTSLIIPDPNKNRR